MLSLTKSCHRGTPERRLRWRLAVWFLQRAIRLAPHGFVAIDLEVTVSDRLNRWTAAGSLADQSTAVGKTPAPSGKQTLHTKEAPPWAE